MGTRSKRKAAPGKARNESRAPDGTGPVDDNVADGMAETDEPAQSAIDWQIVDYPDLDRTRFAERIEPDEVHGWARQLGVSPERLREAIRMAGDGLEDVRRYLTKPH